MSLMTVTYTVTDTPKGAKLKREASVDAVVTREEVKTFRDTRMQKARSSVDMWIHADQNRTRLHAPPGVQFKVVNHELSAKPLDNQLIRKAAEYALDVFEAHTASTTHSLGCDYALSMLRNALGKSLSEQDRRNLHNFNVPLHTE